MGMDPEAAAFRLKADAEGLLLRTPDGEEARFVFELRAGTMAVSSHPKIARQLLLLAEAQYGPDRGEARELSRLIARREDLEDEDGFAMVVWRHAASAHAGAPETYDPLEWVQFGEWVHDQFLLEDAIAKMDEGVPV